MSCALFPDRAADWVLELCTPRMCIHRDGCPAKGWGIKLDCEQPRKRKSLSDDPPPRIRKSLNDAPQSRERKRL